MPATHPHSLGKLLKLTAYYWIQLCSVSPEKIITNKLRLSLSLSRTKTMITHTPLLSTQYICQLSLMCILHLKAADLPPLPIQPCKVRYSAQVPSKDLNSYTVSSPWNSHYKSRAEAMATSVPVCPKRSEVQIFASWNLLPPRTPAVLKLLSLATIPTSTNSTV